MKSMPTNEGNPMAQLEIKDLVKLSKSQASFASTAKTIKKAIKTAGDTADDAQKVIPSLKQVSKGVA
jgi:hypothetical protein